MLSTLLLTGTTAGVVALITLGLARAGRRAGLPDPLAPSSRSDVFDRTTPRLPPMVLSRRMGFAYQAWLRRTKNESQLEFPSLSAQNPSR
jgi:hypothetical protein